MNAKTIFRAINRLAKSMDYEKAVNVIVSHVSVAWDYEQLADAREWWIDYCYCKRVIAMHGESGLH